MNVYNLNFSILVKQFVPVRLRKTKRLAWLRTLIEVIRLNHISFMSYRSEKQYYLSHTSQVCYMEAALNDVFDTVLRRIYIADGPFYDPIFTYLVPEGTLSYLALDSELPGSLDYDAPLWMYIDEETSTVGVQFIVFYPEGLIFNVDRMKALIAKYRLPSKREYILEAYTP